MGRFNEELIAKAVLPSSARDQFGDTIGSFSAIAIDPKSFERLNCAWRMRIFTLPDRGYNTPAKDEYSDYPGRIHAFDLTISEKTDARLHYVSTHYLRDADGAQTTGLDPGKGTKMHLGVEAPAGDRGLGKSVPRRLSLDAEGLARCADGSFYVSDEFSCSIYLCGPDGRMTGVIQPPPAIAPKRIKRPHFTSHDDDPPKSGRQPNDGFEGLSLSPDGKTLFALMQSPLVQDAGAGPEGERYIRLVTFDVSRRPCPQKTNGHYVVELPVFPATGTTKAPETNCIVALADGDILVLARDGGGHGDRKGKGGKPRPIHFKQVLVGSLRAATNLSGTPFETESKSILRKGRLDAAIQPITLETAIDIANETALKRIGLTTRAGKRGVQQLSAKWEGLCLSPPLDAGSPERLLLISNDNDFLTRDGMMPDRAYDAGLDNPNMILIYRVMIP